MNPLRIAVVGCGHLGRVHARLLRDLEGVELVAVVDSHPPARHALADALAVESLADIAHLAGRVEAAVLAAPTSLHAELGLDLIAQGTHLLIEKPLASTAFDARRLIRAAEHRGVKLAVGHVERFNPAFVAAEQHGPPPVYVEAVRMGGFTFRSMDVGVVLDLMIHDLDLLLALLGSPEVEQVEAVGFPVLTRHEDFAQARITFANGCVANLQSSRVSSQTSRQMTIHGFEQQLVVDFAERSVRALRCSPRVREPSWNVERLGSAEIERLRPRLFEELLLPTDLSVAETNPLRDELVDFVGSLRESRPPRVPGEAALQALELAEQILQQIRVNAQRRTAASRRQAA